MTAYMYIIDLLAILVIGFYGAVCGFAPLPDRPVPNDSEKLLAATAVMEACKAGLSVAAIVFPVLTGILIFFLDPEKVKVANATQLELLSSLRITTLWVGASLLLGVYNMCYIPRLADGKRLLNYDRKVAFFGSLQLTALMAGVLRGMLLIYSL